jgi:CheY-like chemotaxis protein
MRVLLVNDEPGIQEVFGSMLVAAGHQIEPALDGGEAFQIYCDRGPFDLVLTDLEHPGLNGFELASRIWKKDPKQSVGFVTAYPVLRLPCDRDQFLEFVESLKPSS